jgi:hypothetical protein
MDRQPKRNATKGKSNQENRTEKTIEKGCIQESL